MGFEALTPYKTIIIYSTDTILLVLYKLYEYSLKHAILGFLSYLPLSGYDLKKAFDNSVQHFWPANQSQIYRTLAELEQNGLVTMEVIEREERLDMKIYHVTEAGRAELHTWLTTPQPERDDREPFLI